MGEAARIDPVAVEPVGVDRVDDLHEPHQGHDPGKQLYALDALSDSLGTALLALWDAGGGHLWPQGWQVALLARLAPAPAPAGGHPLRPGPTNMYVHIHHPLG